MEFSAWNTILKSITRNYSGSVLLCQVDRGGTSWRLVSIIEFQNPFQEIVHLTHALPSSMRPHKYLYLDTN